jgi:hypothetical protein
MRSAIVRIDESRVEVELIDLVKFQPESLGWHFRYPQVIFLGSYFSLRFQSVRVMAASLRATETRASAGRVPRSTNRW